MRSLDITRVFTLPARTQYGVNMYSYKPWDLDTFLKQQMGHCWKAESRTKKNRPRCGARCRDGHRCKARAVVDKTTDEPINGRCRMHGGLSTGPKTPEGISKVREAASRGMKEYWIKRKGGWLEPTQNGKKL